MLTGSGASVLAILIFLVAGFSFIYLRNCYSNLRAQIDYEDEFMKLHYETINRQRDDDQEIIPLTFQRQDQQYLIYLCRLLGENWKMARFNTLFLRGRRKPGIEDHYFRFRTIRLTPAHMRIRLVRCAAMYALVDAGDNRSGYFLQLNEVQSNSTRLVFQIAMKFKYNEPPPQVAHQEMEPHVQ